MTWGWLDFTAGFVLGSIAVHAWWRRKYLHLQQHVERDWSARNASSGDST